MYGSHLVLHKSIVTSFVDEWWNYKVICCATKAFSTHPIRFKSHSLPPAANLPTITGNSCMLWFISAPFFTHWGQWMVFWFPWWWLFFPLIKWNLLVPFSPTWLKGYTIMNQGQCKWERQRQRAAGQLLGWNGAGVYLWHCPWIIIKRNIKRSPLPPNGIWWRRTEVWHQAGHSRLFL